MPETEEVVTRVRMDTTDFDEGVRRVDSGFTLVGRSGGNLLRTLLVIRGAFGATESLMKKFGASTAQSTAVIDTMNVALSVGIAVLATYRAATAITTLIRWLDAKAAAAQASAHAAIFTFGAGAILVASIIAGAWLALDHFTPRAQFGGVFMPRPGGTMVRVAESGRPEAVVPLGRGSMGGGDVTVNMTVMTNDPDELVRVLGRRIQTLRQAGY